MPDSEEKFDKPIHDGDFQIENMLYLDSTKIPAFYQDQKLSSNITDLMEDFYPKQQP